MSNKYVFIGGSNYVKEKDIISWVNYNNLTFLDCSCNVTKKNIGKRREVKELIENLRKSYDNIDINIMRSAENVHIDSVLRYKKNDEIVEVLEGYEEE